MVHKATHKDPEECYQTATEFADELERVLDDQPVTAPAYRYRLDLQEALGRRPSGVVLGTFLCFFIGCAGFLVVPVVGLSLSTVGPTLLNAILGLAVALPICAGMGWISVQLLAGRKSAWWAGIAVATTLAGLVLMGFISAAAAVAIRIREVELHGSDDFAVQNLVFAGIALDLVPLLLGLFCAVMMFVSLIRPSTRAWYRDTAVTRREHEEMLKTLAD